jgi:zinc transport system substrate-binding protein
VKTVIFRVLLGLGLVASANVARAAETAPTVVVSVKPLYGLVAAVMEGVGKPTLLIRGAASPHSYALRPSDREALEKARLVFWVGPSLETFLVRPLESIDNAHVVAVAALPGLTLLPARAGGLWESHDDHVHGGSDTNDPHLWLDIGNAKVIVQDVARELAGADPAHAKIYARNSDVLLGRLDALDAALRTQLAPVAAKPFIVFHDSIQYLEARYGLHAVGAITVSPERVPGAARIAAIRDRITHTGAACVFSEPPFEPKLATMLVSGTSAKMGMLDAEGIALDAEPDLYFKLMQGLADNLVGCLGKP